MLDIHQTFSSFLNLPILIVGDLMLDRYIHGQVDRISPEAPVPIIDVQQQETRLGGAANVALNIKALGGKPLLCGVIGQDAYGEEILRLLKKENIDSSLVLKVANRKTTCKTRILSQNQQLLRFDEEDKQYLTKEQEANFLHLIQSTLEKIPIRAILFQDYNKGVLSLAIINAILKEAWKQDIPTVVDPKATNFYAYKGVTLFKPNLREINEQMPFPVTTTLPDLKKAVEHLERGLNHTNTLITLSEKGLFFADKTAAKIIPTTPRSIADVCGAGDSVISVAALGIASRIDLEQIAILCNLAGGQVCEKVGVVSVDREQLMRDYTTNFTS